MTQKRRLTRQRLEPYPGDGSGYDATPIRKIFQEAFAGAGLPYFNPHSLRNTLMQLGQEVCRTPEEFKAWSQNLGHEKVLPTFLSYGEVACQREGDIIRGLATSPPAGQPDTAADAITKAVFARLRASGMADRRE